MKIEANIVTVNNQDSVTSIGFTDNEYNSKNYVLLSFDQGEPNAGLHIEVNDQKCSGYGLVQHIHFLDSLVVIELTQTGAKELNADSTITITILPKVQNWPSLRIGIARLLSQWIAVSE